MKLPPNCTPKPHMVTKPANYSSKSYVKDDKVKSWLPKN